MLFSELQLSPPILKALEEEGYTTPTPIQEKSIPVILGGFDLLGCAQTGTGKTAAFALPIIQRLAKGLEKQAETPA
jgi:ATP-dependent RNA helicase RhlE